MGLFDTKYVVSVDVITQPLITEADRTDFTKSAVLRAALSNGTMSVSEALVNTYVRGYSWQVDNYLRRAKSVDSLTDLSERTALPQFNDFSAIEAALETLYQETIEVISASISEPKADIFALQELTINYNLIGRSSIHAFDDPVDNRNWECIFENGSFSNTGILTIHYFAQDPAEKDNYEDYRDGQYESFTVDLSHLNFAEDYLHVTYRRGDDVYQNNAYWVYDSATSTLKFPELELENVPTFEEEYYPVLIIRNNFNDLNDTISAAERDKLNRALNPIGLSLDLLHSQILTDSAENDTSIMEDVFFMFGADIMATDRETLQYLRTYFKRLEQRQVYTEQDWNDWVNKNTLNPTLVRRNYFTFSEDDSFKTAIFFTYVKSEIIAGSIPKITRRIVVNPPVNAAHSSQMDTSEYIIETPINDSEYERITVKGLHQRHTVYDEPNGANSKGMYITLDEVVEFENNNENKGIFLPISRTALYNIPGQYRNSVLQNSMRVVIYASDVTKVKWYERGAFITVVQIVIVAISVMSQNYQNIGWALALEVATNLILNIIIGRILVELLEIAVEILGIENAAIIAAVTIVVAIAYGVAVEDAVMSDVATLLEVADATIEAATNVLMEEYSNLMNDFIELQQEYADAYDILQEAKEDLNNGLDLNYIFSQYGNVPFYETPNTFYNRTLEINKADVSTQSISRFAETMLRLPKEVDITALNEINRGGI